MEVAPLVGREAGAAAEIAEAVALRPRYAGSGCDCSSKTAAERLRPTPVRPPWSRLLNVPRSAALNLLSGLACHPVAMNLKQTASITAAVAALVTSVAT